MQQLFDIIFTTSFAYSILRVSTPLILAGMATGASWLCYYRALQLGEASKVVPVDKMSVVITLILAFIFLHESFTVKSLAGAGLITIGTLFMVL